MNKKVKIILLFLGIFIALAYIFRGPEWPEQELVSRPSVSSSPEVVDLVSALTERPWDEELQKKFLAGIKGKEKLPKFENFPATDLANFANNEDVKVNINSHPIGKEFRTAIRHGVKYNGINFNGKYSITKWGCGSTCQDGVIVDADTGHIYPLPSVMSNGYEARKDSRLLIQNPIIAGGDWTKGWYRVLYWEWTGNGFRLLGVYKADLMKQEIVKTEEDFSLTLPLWAQL